MSVEFNENNYAPRPDFGVRKQSKMVGWVMSTGLVKNKNQANKVLLGVGIFFILLSIFFTTSSSTNPPIQQNTILPNETIGSEQGR